MADVYVDDSLTAVPFIGAGKEIKEYLETLRSEINTVLIAIDTRNASDHA